MENQNIDSEQVIRELSLVIERENKASKILAASFKNMSQVTRAIGAGAQSVTVGPEVYEAAFNMPSIQQAVDDFAKDWETTYQSQTL